MKEGFTEAQCNLLYQAEMWKEERAQVLKERAELLAENKRLRAALSIIAGYEQCIDNTLGNVEIARIALEQKP